MFYTTNILNTSRCLRSCIHPSSRSFVRSLPRNFPRIGRFTSGKSSQSILPTFRDQVARSTEVESFGSRFPRPTIRNQVLFFIGGSLLAYSIATSQTEIDTEYWSKRLVSVSHVWTLRPPTTEEMRKAQYLELGKYLQTQVNQLKDTLAEWPLALRNLVLSVYVQAAQSYLDAPEGRRLCWLICGVNTAIYLMWKIPRLAPFMTRSFTHHPLSGRSYTLLTSMFSHKSFIHLLANSMALASFGSAATHYFTLEQLKHGEHQQEATAKWHFLAFFISAGLFSGLVSHVAACKVLFPRLINQYTASAVIKNSPAAAAISSTAAKVATTAPREILPSLGASGAIYAAVTVSALAFPDAQVSLIFPPFVSIPIQTGVGGLVILDMIGIVRGWRMFDHYAHLGGAAFGAMYYMYGPQWWAFMRNKYQRLRSPTS
ncbi:hypothetical protein DEU56DRAFT_833416 [Suillus clintonianus]|uniref:uncharacterized protein n=1 Tax=Suillus clintonianus TaxID=1904413 RepID=UPI001B86B976|nr:uncharacterized protein DEU56DRAFT_833416 [Suillus clintonianus]KAG2121870.1 hypothetical protein DEU56DRAFT_833416 [Suillus clintonianus]